VVPAVKDPDVVVVGAGLGGLTTGACLARHGVHVLVLEATSQIGGKASSRLIEGVRFPLGANTFGAGASRILGELGVKLRTVGAPIGVVMGTAELTFPARFTALIEARKLGIGPGRVLGVMRALAAARMRRGAAGAVTYQQLVDALFPEPALRELLYLEACMLGTRPADLPASAFDVFFSRQYGYHRPFYPTNGAQAIADALAGVIRAAGGEVLDGSPADAITVENGTATGVVSLGRWIPAGEAVISNADLGATLCLLRGAPPNGELDLLREKTRRYRSGLSLACLLLLVRPDTPLLSRWRRRGYFQTSTLLLDGGVDAGLRAVEAGDLPDAPMLNVVGIEALLAAQAGTRDALPVVVLTVWPRATVSPSVRERFVDHVFDRLDRLCRGFSASVTWHRLLDPEAYRAEFGVDSCPAPVLDSPSYEKERWALPVRRLYNVGTTVLPAGAHTSAAMESGRCCARLVLADRTAPRRRFVPVASSA
jgi:phytoene dehydrogenase-like protein